MDRHRVEAGLANPDRPDRAERCDLGIIHPYAVAGPGGDVTRAAAPITAAPASPLAGTGPSRHTLSVGSGVARRAARSPHFEMCNCR